VSSLAGRRRRTYVPRLRARDRLWHFDLPHLPAGPTLAVGVALAIMFTAFVARGGTAIERTTWTEVALLLGGAVLSGLALIVPRSPETPPHVHGAAMLVAFALLTAFTTLSISWSLMAHDSWLESSRTLSYLATLAGGVALGRLVPRRWSWMIIGVAAASTLICAYAVLTKVFPGWLNPDSDIARLRPPFDYWNSVGLAAGVGIVSVIWLGARRSGHAALNALAWPALGVLIICMLLSYSRGALLAVGIALAVWLAFVPVRLRTVTLLAGVLIATIPTVTWVFSQDGLTKDDAPSVLQTDAGLSLGALLLLLVVALTIAGLAVGFLSAHKPVSERTRARVSRVLVAAVVVTPAVAILMLANAPGGLTGQVSKAWKQATVPAISAPANSPSRLTETSSSRSRYWHEAFKIYERSPWIGNGAGSYGTLRLRYRTDGRRVEHAHGFVMQTLPDLGWVGLGLATLTLLAWLAAAARTLGVRPRDRGLPWDAERIGVAALALVVLVFGLHSTVDWTWFVPGNIVPALLCAGWVASRSGLRQRLTGLPAAEPSPPTRARMVAAALVVVVATAAAWAALQPLRSVHAQAASLDRLAVGALPQAESIARIAHARDPLAVEPLFQLAEVQQAEGRRDEASRTIQRTIEMEPDNPETWRHLGQLRLTAYNDPNGALKLFLATYFIDPKSVQSRSDVLKLMGSTG
jgi:hypothetical protein